MRGTGEARLAKRQAERVQQVQAFRGVGEGTLALLKRACRAKALGMDALLYGLYRHAERTGWL